jgi:hypothetical protein
MQMTTDLNKTVPPIPTAILKTEYTRVKEKIKKQKEANTDAVKKVAALREAIEDAVKRLKTKNSEYILVMDEGLKKQTEMIKSMQAESKSMDDEIGRLQICLRQNKQKEANVSEVQDAGEEQLKSLDAEIRRLHLDPVHKKHQQLVTPPGITTLTQQITEGENTRCQRRSQRRAIAKAAKAQSLRLQPQEDRECCICLQSALDRPLMATFPCGNVHGDAGVCDHCWKEYSQSGSKSATCPLCRS